MRLNIAFTIVIILALVPAVPIYAGYDIRLNEQALSDVFDSGKNMLGVDTNLPLPLIPSAVQVSTVPLLLLDIDALCYGKGLCVLAPAVDQQLRIPQFAIDFMQNFNDYGTPLNIKETEIIEKALADLNDTALGKKICKNLEGGNCSIESLANKGIKIQTRAVIEKDFAAKTLIYAGKILIVTNRQPEFSGRNPLFWASVLGHELSHAEDYKIFKHGLDELGPDTETKAYLSQLAIYNELKARYPHETNDSVMNFLLEVWAWKENGGPYPKDFYDNDGIFQPAIKFINDHVNPSRKGTDAIRNMAVKYYYKEYQSNPVPVVLNVQYYEFIKNLEMRGIEYNKWRINNPGLANLTAQPIQQPLDDNNNGGDHHGGGEGYPGGGSHPGVGGGGQPGIPNPQFPPGTWPTSGQ
ncbi:MAG: hypothetical protein Q7R35_08735 [Elusimicrobiota bacterium]|nr:hypothetical protein [Elusimicrobiota bacterium]